jgi:hypothetical protein
MPLKLSPEHTLYSSPACDIAKGRLPHHIYAGFDDFYTRVTLPVAKS